MVVQKYLNEAEQQMKALYQTMLKSQLCGKFWNQAIANSKVSNQKYNCFISVEAYCTLHDIETKYMPKALRFILLYTTGRIQMSILSAL